MTDHEMQNRIWVLTNNEEVVGTFSTKTLALEANEAIRDVGDIHEVDLDAIDRMPDRCWEASIRVEFLRGSVLNFGVNVSGFKWVSHHESPRWNVRNNGSSVTTVIDLYYPTASHSAMEVANLAIQRWSNDLKDEWLRRVELPIR